jgi:hypothetical protein
MLKDEKLEKCPRRYQTEVKVEVVSYYFSMQGPAVSQIATALRSVHPYATLAFLRGGCCVSFGP